MRASSVRPSSLGFMDTRHSVKTGSHIARAILRTGRRVQISSRHPNALLESMKHDTHSNMLSAIPIDITKSSTIAPALGDAHTVISLVGILHGTPKQFEDIQWKGAANVAQAARDVGAKLVHFSAIGADPASSIPYARTKGLGEAAALEICPDATVIRPSLVFGPEDDFFNVGV